MDIYSKYEGLGLTDYKLRSVEDIMAIHGTDITKMKGLDNLVDEDKTLVIKLFIGYLNGCGCNNRKAVPIEVSKINKNKFKVYFKDGKFSYLFRDGSIG